MHIKCITPVPCLAGISESAGVALGMFVVHVFTLTAVCVLSALYAFFNVTILKENLQQVRWVPLFLCLWLLLLLLPLPLRLFQCAITFCRVFCCVFSIVFCCSITPPSRRTPPVPLQDFPDVKVGGTVVAGTWYTAILFGVSSAMLGVSGFESSSQFVEEQAKGVFVKTLRNMQVHTAVI